MTYRGLLKGVRVLDLTNVLAGPYASYQLALLGADVVKVELPVTGDLARQLGADESLSDRHLGASFLAQNAGKRSITVNLKTAAGKDVFARLVASTDVLLENFRPGVLARLGFGWPQLREINAGLIYCAVSGFGSTGPWSSRPAYDQIIQGLSGMMSVTGSPETAPTRVGYPICDSLGGLTAALAICAALVRKARTGDGAMLDVSMLDAAISAMGWVVSDHLIAGQKPIPMANENRTSAPSGTFDTADGQLNIAANKQEQFEALCRALGRDELITDPRFVTRADRKHNRGQLRAELELTLRGKSAEDWDGILLTTGVPAAPVVSVVEALRSSQIRHRALISTVPNPGDPLDEIEIVSSAIHLDGEALPAPAPPPKLGQHTDEILAEVGLNSADIARLHDAGAI